MTFENLLEGRCPRQMNITTCYTVPIKRQLNIIMPKSKKEQKIVAGERPVDGNLMRQTDKYCLSALRLCVDIFLQEWKFLSSLPSQSKKGVPGRKRAADCLIHSTKDNQAKYPAFDKLNPDMPAYTRRAIVAKALGIVSSYQSNHANWEKMKPDERGVEPILGFPDSYELTFYEQERDVCDLEKGIIGLKLYNGKVWDWYYFMVGASDARYIDGLRKHRTMLSPIVEKSHGRYQIRFSFEENKTPVSDADMLSYTILAVDLGINAPASWCIMTADGTVHAKGVIHLPCEEDRLNHLINRKRMYQAAGKRSHSIYRMVTAANKRLSVETSRGIMRIAVLYSADCIVFEHLDRNGSAKGKKYRERIHMWRAQDVQKRALLHAHRNCMRISRVCAWGTSRYAFDGSGAVSRGKNAGLKTYSVCRFPNGKVYNCDLSAAQNIGARFFLREYAKRLPDPEFPATPQRTYTTLYKFVESISA